MNKMSYTRATAKNRRKIQEAFAELLAERGSLSNISVTELAERAEITRGTFYNYYDNLYQVGAELQNEVEERLFSEYDNLSTLEGLEKYIDEVFVFFESQEGIYRELLSSDASTDFLHQLEKSMSQRMKTVLQKNGVTDKDAEMELLFTINGAIAVVRKHYRGEIDLTLAEIRDYLKAKIGWMFRKYLA
jgi:AcrR family transcriptional regulator